MGKNQHVVPAGDKWGIKGEGNSRLTSTLGSEGLVPLTLRQNDILTFEKWRPSHTIWKKMRLKYCTKKRLLCSISLSKSFSSVLHGSKIPCTYVQAPYGRTSSPPHAVRASTLWTYVHRAKDVRPKDLLQENLMFCTFWVPFLHSLRSAYFPWRSTTIDFIAFSGC